MLLGHPIALLLFFQLIMQSVLAVFVAAFTMMVTSYLQDEWAALPIILTILIGPNVLYMLFPYRRLQAWILLRLPGL